MSTKNNKQTAIEMWQLHAGLLLEHGVDLTNRSFCINADIEQSLFDVVDRKMSILEKDSHEPIIIKLNSAGGEVIAGWALVSRIKASPCKITIEAHGCVMSAATMLLACADVRRASKYCTIMFHEGSLEAAGKVSDVRDIITAAAREERMYVDFLVKYSTKSRQFWAKMISSNKDTYLTAQQVLKLGIIDEVF